MKIKYVLSVFIVLLYFFPSIAYTQEMNALEQVYKEQHDKYTAEIKELQVDIDCLREKLDKTSAILERLRQLDLQDGSYRRRYRKSDTDVVSESVTLDAGLLQKKMNRMKELTDKKQELKIKILERKGVLPTWWID